MARPLKKRLGYGAFMRAMIAAALIGAALPIAATTPADANQFRRIADVNVSCNNALRCDLFIANPRVTLFTVGFRRAAAFEAPLSLYLTLREPMAAGSEVRFVVDGAEVLTLSQGAFSYRAALSEYTFSDQDAVRALFAAARAGERLQITFRTRSGQSTAPFSLEGLGEGAIFMDDVQGRDGRDDALQAVGGAAPPPVAAGGIVTDLDAPPAGLARYFDGDGAPCGTFNGGPPEPLAGFEMPVDGDVSLIGMRCGDGGAYNFPFAYWLRAGTYYERLALPVMRETGPGAELLAWNATWDAATGELTAFFRGRGLGDCGVVSRWVLNGSDGGFGFVLREMRVKDDCDGVFDETFESWDQVWPAVTDKS